MVGEARGVNVDEVMGAWRVFLIKDERIFLDGKRKEGWSRQTL